jgi:hypothetical protein
MSFIFVFIVLSAFLKLRAGNGGWGRCVSRFGQIVGIGMKLGPSCARNTMNKMLIRPNEDDIALVNFERCAKC